MARNMVYPNGTCYKRVLVGLDGKVVGWLDGYGNPHAGKVYDARSKRAIQDFRGLPEGVK